MSNSIMLHGVIGVTVEDARREIRDDGTIYYVRAIRISLDAGRDLDITLFADDNLAPGGDVRRLERYLDIYAD